MPKRRRPSGGSDHLSAESESADTTSLDSLSAPSPAPVPSESCPGSQSEPTGEHLLQMADTASSASRVGLSDTSTNQPADLPVGGVVSQLAAGTGPGTPVVGVRKRRRNGANSQEQLKQLLEALLNHKRSDGSYLTELYYHLPKKRGNERFYTMITKPIDLAKIQVNMSNHLYDDVAHLSTDVALLVNNTKQYFPPGSMEHTDAIAIWDVFCEYRRAVFPVESLLCSSSSLAAVSSHTDVPAASKPHTSASVPATITETGVNDNVTTDSDNDVSTGMTPTSTDTSAVAYSSSDHNPIPSVPPANSSSTVVTSVSTDLATPTSASIDFSGVASTSTDSTTVACGTSESTSFASTTPPSSVVEPAGIVETSTPASVVEPAGIVETSIPASVEDQSASGEVSTPVSASKTSGSGRVGRPPRRVSENVPIGDDESETNSSIAAPSEPNSWAPGELEEALEELFSALATATDTDGRRLCAWFQLLPHKKKYPQYYQVIKQPIDLKAIASRIQQQQYQNLHEMETDVALLCRNACTFNEPTSQIYKDARALRKLCHNRRAAIEHWHLTNAKCSERIRSRRMVGVVCCSSEFSQLQYDSDEVESSTSSDTSHTTAAETTFWQLFDWVRSYCTPGGCVLSEPFIALPSRRLYPDYFDEIKNPIALRDIKRKIKNGAYANIQALEADLNLMFDNAKQFNPADSKLHRQAARLQRLVQKKILELTESDPTESVDSDVEMTDDISDSVDRKCHQRASPAAAATPTVSSTAAGDSQSLQLLDRCKLLYATVTNYVHEDGRQLSSIFTQLPSRKQYPDYYDIIESPIDLNTISTRIETQQYDTESEILQDFKLMFNNCRQYNEEGSVIYDDASQLERVLMARVRELGPLPSPQASQYRPRLLNRAQLLDRMRDLYSVIRDYRDPGGRQLSVIFLKLPSKLDYPEYYEVIKRPMHMERIHHKLKTGIYASMDELMADFVLMFENACKFNEPDSIVYKDALSLHRLALQTKLQMTEDLDEVPDVKTLVQDLLTSLFIATYNHQDSVGRCYSDSLAELPEYDEVEGQPRVKGVCLEMVKKGLDRGFYTRLDVFQQDMLAVFERARRLSRPDSHIFDDSVEMQMFYLDYRDELCRNGTLLTSPALQLTQAQFEQEVAQLKAAVKLEEEDSRDSTQVKGVGGDSMSFNQINYTSGEFVYVENKDSRIPALHIVLIERLWINNEGQQVMYGSVFIRPEETVHTLTRKFYHQEVFKSDQHINSPMSKVVGKCCVLTVHDFFNMKPVGFEDKDVFVCESRYSTKTRTFKKIKVFTFAAPVNMARREVPLEPKRVATPFCRLKEEGSELDDIIDMFKRREPQDVILDRSAVDPQLLQQQALVPDLVYYQQMIIAGELVVKNGDCVYIRTEGDKQRILQISAMWLSPDGVRYVHGTMFVAVGDVASSGQQMFYRQEVMVATGALRTHPASAVLSRCCVLSYTDYCSRRVTEIAEDDVFVCENRYDQQQRQIVLATTGDSVVDSLAVRGRECVSASVVQDEIYHFRRLLVLRRQTLADIRRCDSERLRVKNLLAADEAVASPSAISKLGEEDSLDGLSAPTITNDVASVSTPTFGKKVRRVKVLTGYILFSADVRKKITSENPEANFGDISRLVGVEWKKLPQSMRAVYEERAQRTNAEAMAARRDDVYDSSAPSPIPARSTASLVGADVVYDCCWLRCDYQFEEMTDLIDHCLAEHVPNTVTSGGSTSTDESQCLWRGCSRVRKGTAPFPNSARMVRHLREVHILRNNGRRLANIELRSKNFVARRSVVTSSASLALAGNTSMNSSSALPTSTSAAVSNSPVIASSLSSATAAAAVSDSAAPKFVSVPAQPQKLLHSETYLRYIEGLNANSTTSCGWQQQLQLNYSTAASLTADTAARLPLHWLSPEVVSTAAERSAVHSSSSSASVAALWHLRDYLMKDALGISRAYNTHI